MKSRWCIGSWNTSTSLHRGRKSIPRFDDATATVCRNTFFVMLGVLPVSLMKMQRRRCRKSMWLWYMGTISQFSSYTVYFVYFPHIPVHNKEPGAHFLAQAKYLCIASIASIWLLDFDLSLLKDISSLLGMIYELCQSFVCQRGASAYYVHIMITNNTNIESLVLWKVLSWRYQIKLFRTTTPW